MMMFKKVLLFIIAFVCLIGCSSNQQASSQNIEIAREYVQAMIDKDYDNLVNNFEYDEQMQQAINNNQLIPALSMGMDTLGEMKEQKEPFELSIDGKTAVHFPTVFENQKVNITVSFDENHKIIGVFFNEYSENH